MTKNNHGFSIVEVLIIAAVIGLIGVLGWKFIYKSDTKNPMATTNTGRTTDTKKSESPTELLWRQTANGWQASQTAPECPAQPMMQMPADIKHVTSVLYPGQLRGGIYKPHGGFRFDKASGNSVSITAPIDGYIIRGGRYLAAETTNEVQYTFDIMNNCGVMYRVGHLRELPENMQKIADTFPEATASSATQNVNPAVYVKQGTTLASKVGTIIDGNTFFDWGVFDYRQPNEASKSAAYQVEHPQPELSWHAVCWLRDWLPAHDAAALAKLPAGDPTSGKNSDYCK